MSLSDVTSGLYQAVRAGDLPRVREIILREGLDLPHSLRHSATTLAAQHNQRVIMDYLLSHGGTTTDALIGAIRGGRMKLVRALAPSINLSKIQSQIIEEATLYHESSILRYLNATIAKQSKS
jgi:hypothetical protein